ncbi:hypothetical protein [Laspinema olomoucense]|uniref:Uncharacterized protein n=1 Tax=Laspinema olomoucense D3b TaxID=2953688 RepID=A0ABT2N4J3_9CYAN|nr:hypothetical protein [Laspinema sp. D3b]MCT7977606.1 hypothetical protein [Laspinema sp. D3b]
MTSEMRKYWLSIVLPCVLGMWVAISLHAIIFLRELINSYNGFYYILILFFSLTGPFIAFITTPGQYAFVEALFISIVLLPAVCAYIIKPGYWTAIISRVGICIWIGIGYAVLAILLLIGFGECIYKSSC